MFRIEKLDGQLVNCFVIRMKERQQQVIVNVGITVVSLLHQPLLFVVVRGQLDRLLTKKLHGTSFTLKPFKGSENLRISGSVRGSITSPAEDFSDLLTEFLLRT